MSRVLRNELPYSSALHIEALASAASFVFLSVAVTSTRTKIFAASEYSSGEALASAIFILDQASHRVLRVSSSARVDWLSVSLSWLRKLSPAILYLIELASSSILESRTLASSSCSLAELYLAR